MEEYTKARVKKDNHKAKANSHTKTVKSTPAHIATTI